MTTPEPEQELTPPPGKLRTGYTTGTCATAATRGALLALIHQCRVERVSVWLPAGFRVTFALHTCHFCADEARASVIKDAGDDPDVTHGAEVCARVRWSEQPGILLQGGPGVGRVTKPGLPVPPGEPAINPVPRQMITGTVGEVLAEAGLPARGVWVEVSIPGGEELARKTFNPRLGIVGGLSILGTTGIVVPYSTEAWQASVVQGIDVAVASGCRHIVLTVGARGETIARRLLALPEEAFVQVGPFFGASLRHCARAGVERVTLAAMVGKLAKFAAGQESVHNTQSAQDFAFLADLAKAAGADAELQARIRQANTAQEASSLMLAAGLTAFHTLICRRAWEFACGHLQLPFPMEVLLTGMDGALLAR
jgi:cobalt-precorrin-5B (C1)-methyltransferase